jgi:hypothetical protein
LTVGQLLTPSVHVLFAAHDQEQAATRFPQDLCSAEQLSANLTDSREIWSIEQIDDLVINRDAESVQN